MQNDGGPAFPQPLIETRDGAFEWPSNGYDLGGMSLRDYFAVRAPEASESWLQMIRESQRMANPHNDTYKPKRESELELRARWKYQYADAMLSARAEGK